MKKPKIAIVHDWLYGGGAEKVVESIHKIYPDAPIYTSYCSDEWRQRLNNKVITGYLQKWPFSSLRRFLPVLRQRWFSNLDLSQYDIIISSSGNGEAKFITKSRPEQLHICYCHTPTHFYWRHYEQYIKLPSIRPRWLARAGLKTLLKPLRKKDYQAAQNVDFFFANSTAIKHDIKQFYNRDSQVIFPPVNTIQFSKLADQNILKIPKKPKCIIWGRVVPLKRIDLAIEACNQLGWELNIMGDGPDIDRLRGMAGETVSFLGFVDDKDREKYIKQADLFIFCSHEDFGVAPVEALAAGLPVVAYGKGGALDYINEGKNGWLFNNQTPDSLVDTLKSLPGKSINLETTSRSANGFSEEVFIKEIQTAINKLWSKHENSY